MLHHRTFRSPCAAQVKRTWNPVVRPMWLAFEVESGLQVRPRQAEVALHMVRYMHCSHVLEE